MKSLLILLSLVLNISFTLAQETVKDLGTCEATAELKAEKFATVEVSGVFDGDELVRINLQARNPEDQGFRGITMVLGADVTSYGGGSVGLVVHLDPEDDKGLAVLNVPGIKPFRPASAMFVFSGTKPGSLDKSSIALNLIEFPTVKNYTFEKCTFEEEFYKWNLNR